jgi:hypothetical protein
MQEMISMMNNVKDEVWSLLSCFAPVYVNVSVCSLARLKRV